MSDYYPITYLGNLLCLIKDGTHGTHPRISKGIPFLSAKNISDKGKVVWDNDDSFISESEYQLIHSNFKLEKGDVLLTIVGSIGRRAIYNGEKITFQRSVAYLRPNKNLLDSKYLFHYLLLESFQKELSARSNATAQTGVYLGQLPSIPIYLPDIDTQKTIAAILDTLDEAIAAAEALLAKQEKMKQGLLQDLLTRGVDDNGQLRPPYHQRPDLYQQTELGWIPKTWKAQTINDLAIHVGSGVTPRGGSTVYTTSGILFIRSQNVTFQGLKLNDVAYIDSGIHQTMKSSEIFPHDVLLNITGASIGRCCPVPEDFETANVNQHVCAIRFPKANKTDACFLSLVLSSHIGQNQIARFNAGGNREGLNYQQIRSFLIPWSEYSEREKITELLTVQDDEIIAVSHELGKLKKIKTGLLQDLLTGRRRVTPELIQQAETLSHSAA